MDFENLNVVVSLYIFKHMRAQAILFSVDKNGGHELVIATEVSVCVCE